jgi:hypothetical protein
MMVWFVLENRRTRRAHRKPLELLAVVMMIVAVYLMLGVITTRAFFATPLDAPVAAALSAVK